MGDEFIFAGLFQCCEAQKHRMIAEVARKFCLLHRLVRFADGPGNHKRLVWMGICLLGGQFQHRAQQAMVANFELGRVHTHCKPYRTGIQIIARQRALMAFAELPIGVQRQWMSRNDATTSKFVPSCAVDHGWLRQVTREVRR